MRKKVIISSILSLAWTLNTIAQQDKHLSMWSENLSQINPAAAGVIDEDLRFLTNFRLQWLPLNGNAFRTNTFSFDAKLLKNKSTGSHLGIGLNFTNDQTGDVRLTSNIISVPISYSIGLDKLNMLSIGISPGFYSQSIGTGNQTWNNQWNDSQFDQTISSGEIYQASFSSIDIGAGIQFKHKFDENSHINLGFSANHLTSTNSGTSMTNNLYRNTNFYITGSKFIPERRFGISPQVLVSLMGPNNNIILGSYFDHELFESSKRTDYVQRSLFSYGFFYRWKDAFIASISYKFNGFKVGLSYDFNLSKLSTATRSSGGFEFFLKYSLMTDRSNFIHDRKTYRFKGGGGRL
jgi:type IX secretion system PorP/SprF family membrane protein